VGEEVSRDELEEEEIEEGLVIEPEKGKVFRCRYCGREFPNIQALGAHMRWCKKRRRAEREVEEEVEREEEVVEERGELSDRELVLYYGREGLRKVMLKRLTKMIEDMPIKIPINRAKAIKWIESRWEYNPRISEDPNLLYAVLTRECGIPDKIAATLVDGTFAVEREFADILAERGERIFTVERVAPTGEPPTPVFRERYYPRYTPRYEPRYYPDRYFTPPTTYPSYTPPVPYPYYPTPTISRERERVDTGKFITKDELDSKFKEFSENIISKVSKIMEEKKEKDRIDKLEDRINKLALALNDVINKIENIPEMVKSITEGEKKKDREYELLKDLFKEREGRLKEREEALAKYLEDLRSRYEEMVKKYEETKDKMSEIQREMLEERIKDTKEALEKVSEVISTLRSELKETKEALKEYKSDAFRLIGQGISEITGLAKERRPIRELATILSTPPPSEKVEEGAVGGLASRLRKEWVVSE